MLVFNFVFRLMEKFIGVVPFSDNCIMSDINNDTIKDEVREPMK